MTFETYKNRYCKAYEKQLAKLNVLEAQFDDGKLKAAYDTYINPNLWYHRAFRPSSLAQMGVVYYDYQIRTALPELNDEELMNLCRNDPQKIHTAIKNNLKYID